MRVRFAGRVAADPGEMKHRVVAGDIGLLDVADVLFHERNVGIPEKVERRVVAVHEVVEDGDAVTEFQQGLGKLQTLITSTSGDQYVHRSPITITADCSGSRSCASNTYDNASGMITGYIDIQSRPASIQMPHTRIVTR